jgi:hypothetical protein
MFTNDQELKIIEVLQSFLDDEVGSEWLGDAKFRIGEDAVQYCDYAEVGFPCLFIDGSILYDLINYGEDKWEFVNKFDEFLTRVGLWYELGNAWNMTFYPLNSEQETMKKVLDYPVYNV